MVGTYASKAAPLTIDVSCSTRMRNSRKIVWIAWILFVASLFCPSVMTDMGAWNKPTDKYFPGYLCVALCPPYYASNTALLLAPLLLWIFRRWQRLRWPSRSLSVFFLLSGIGSLCMLPQFLSVRVGYVLWVASFFMASIGAWFEPVLRKNSIRTQTRLP